MSKEQGLMSWALIGTIAIHAAIGVPVAVLASDDEDEEHIDLSKYKVIEAALAYKKEDDTPKQPQKDRKPKPKADKPVGVSRDDEKDPVTRPDAGPPPSSAEDLEKLAKEFLEQHKDEGDEAPKEGGDFNGSEHGFAEIGKGEPYFQELAADFFNSWELPSLEKGQGKAIISIRLDATGRIIDTEFKESNKSGNANIDRSVQLAVRAMTKARENGDKPVPAYLLKEATEQWISFSSDQFVQNE